MTVQRPNRALAFLAYLLPVVGPLLVLLFNRKNSFALYHACQSLALTAAAIIVPVAWVVIGWILAWVPLAGALLAIAMFALVMAGYIVIVIGLVSGLINSLRAKQAAAPIFGGWGESLFMRIATPAYINA
jgi:uncharacterized membrane protein